MRIKARAGDALTVGAMAGVIVGVRVRVSVEV